MSTGSEPLIPPPDGLQFDRAEFEKAIPSEVSCAACNRPIDDRYFEINGTIVCEPCRQVIETRLRGGSSIARLGRALIFGTGAGIVGTIIYASVLYFSHLDIALVSIFVGYLVGRAVRAGSQNRGGLVYQILAVCLTYLAIGTTYTSILLIQLSQVEAAAAPQVKEPAPGAENPAGGEARISVVRLLLSDPLILSGLILKAPVNEVRGSIISIAIIGFALWQAWKMNVRLRLVVTGPYQVGGVSPALESDGAAPDA